MPKPTPSSNAVDVYNQKMDHSRPNTVWTPEFRAAYEFAKQRMVVRPACSIVVSGGIGFGKSHLIWELSRLPNIASGWRIRDVNADPLELIGIEKGQLITTRESVEPLREKLTGEAPGSRRSRAVSHAHSDAPVTPVELIELPVPDYELRRAIVASILDTSAVRFDEQALRLLADTHESNLNWVVLAARRIATFARLHMRFVDAVLVSEVLTHELTPEAINTTA